MCPLRWFIRFLFIIGCSIFRFVPAMLRILDVPSGKGGEGPFTLLRVGIVFLAVSRNNTVSVCVSFLYYLFFG